MAQARPPLAYLSEITPQPTLPAFADYGDAFSRRTAQPKRFTADDWRDTGDLRGRLAEAGEKYLGMSPQQANTVFGAGAEPPLLSLSDITPGLDTALAINDTRKAYGEGDYLGAGLSALGAIPMAALGAKLAKGALKGGKAGVAGAMAALGVAGTPTEAEGAPSILPWMKHLYAPVNTGSNFSAGLDNPANRAIQTVQDPIRMMYPGIYGNPKEIARVAGERVGEESPLLKRLWGVDREDLFQMSLGRLGNEVPVGLERGDGWKGSEAARKVMTMPNAQRLQDILAEAGGVEGLRRTDAWYIMDPMFHRMKEMFGHDEAVRRYKHLNTLMGMASPASAVDREIMRGTAMHAMHQQGRWDDVAQISVPEHQRGPDFPADLRHVPSHPYFRTSTREPAEKYLREGRIVSDAPKVPLYVQSSGVPETGFQTRAPVGDAHWSRGVGLADTRPGVSAADASFSPTELQTLQPWWQNRVAHQVGIEPGPAQARLWTTLGPQTGVQSELGAGKLELLSQAIAETAHRLGVSLETARDMVLKGEASAGGVRLPPGPR